jgi:hypothetical protein
VNSKSQLICLFLGLIIFKKKLKIIIIIIFELFEFIDIKNKSLK